MSRTHHVRVGLHGRNAPIYQELDYKVLREARIETVKMMAYTPVDVYRRIRQEINPEMEFIVRLGFPNEFGLDERGRGRHPSPTEFVSRALPIVNGLRDYVTKFEIHNEPNHRGRYEGWGPDITNAEAFRSWYAEVLQALKQAAPWASFGFPGLAPHHPDFDGDLPWLEACRSVIEASDWLGVHCYWQHDNMLNDDWGLRFKKYHERFPRLPIEITEFGDSTENRSRDVIADEYPRYYAELSHYPYVRSASAFILSSPDPTWDMFVWRKENGEIMPVVQTVGALDRTPVTVGIPEIPWLLKKVPQPPIQDISDELPKHPTATYPGRTRKEIKRIVIHHTVAKTTPEVIARYQVNTFGWPGIGYHFVIMEDGTIYQTEPVAAVSHHTTSHNEDTIGVAFVGNFMDGTPNQAQLQAGAHLVAYLIDQFDLTLDDVIGRREIEAVQSPGDQWDRGANWKQTLLEGARAYLEGGSPDLMQRLAAAESAVARLEASYQKLLAEPGGEIAQLRTDLQALEAEVDRLEKVAQSQPGIGYVPPEIQDISTELIHHPTEQYPTRSLDTIKRVIVHHTVTLASPQRIAEYQIQNAGLPGIGYHFMVMRDGTIYQTEPLETVSHHTLTHNEDSVGVALSGNFSNSVPEATQLDASAQLIAYLLRKLNLTTDAVVGRNELEVVGSPGSQWLEGARWKETLLAQVETYLAAAEGGDAALVAQLRARIRELTNQVTQLEGEKSDLEDEVKRLSVAVNERDIRITELGKELQNLRQGRPKIIDVVDSLPKHPTKRYGKRTEEIQYIAIHHTTGAGMTPPERIAEWVIRPDTRDWPGFPYHFYVLADGTIYQCQRIETRSYHVGASNNVAVGISMAGNFVNKVNGRLTPLESRLPTREQLISVARVAAWLMKELNLPLEQVMGHKELPQTATTCPGDQWLTGATYKNTLHRYIQAVMDGKPFPPPKLIPEYLLFWDHGGDQWARQDWELAQDYIAVVRPTAGFSVQDAMAAQRVVIVGGEAGVSSEDEQKLRESGCEVIRLAGRDEAETHSMLMELISQYRPDTSTEPVPPGPLVETAGMRSVEELTDPWVLPPSF
ncbi:MAG TPA: hypothetical protein EYH31_02730 [Anaerolineae bacterium]|nr:hypothetical protein [Anaerolineae bacterium]